MGVIFFHLEEFNSAPLLYMHFYEAQVQDT